METTSPTVKDESTMTLEEKRREARKKRISANTGNRLSYIQSHTSELKNDTEPSPEEIIKREAELKKQQKQDANPLESILGLVNQVGGGGASLSQEVVIVKDSISFTILRWFGVLFFSLVFIINSLLSCSPELLNIPPTSEQQPTNSILYTILQQYQSMFKVLNSFADISGNSGGGIGKSSGGGNGGINLNQQTTNQLIFIYLPLFLVWLIWEFIIVTRNKKQQVQNRSKTFLSFARSDALLIAFFYVIILDSILRFKHLLFSTDQLQFIKDDYLISILHYPLIISIIGQFIINSIPKSFPIINIDQRIFKVYQAVTHFVLAVLNLLLFLDSWECSSCHCSSSFGLLWILSSRARGLFLWSHICINFASRIF